MAKLQIVAGDHGEGRAHYDAGVFSLPNGHRRGAETVSRIVSSGTVQQKDFSSALGAGLGAGAVTVPLLAIAGLFFAPVAAIASPFGVAALVGAAAFFGTRKDMAFVQIIFDDGTKVAVICDEALPPLILNDRVVAQSVEMRKPRAMLDVSPRPRKFGSASGRATPLPRPQSLILQQIEGRSAAVLHASDAPPEGDGAEPPKRDSSVALAVGVVNAAASTVGRAAGTAATAVRGAAETVLSSTIGMIRRRHTPD
jgi:hypothetical protein